MKIQCHIRASAIKNLPKFQTIVFHRIVIQGWRQRFHFSSRNDSTTNYNSRCPCWLDCLNTTWGKRWTQMRTSVLSVVGTPAFEWFILVLIFASSITLCFEDIHLDSNKTLKQILYWTNFAFSLIFVVEMVLKWMALGFKNYFTSFWTILDFIIVFVSELKIFSLPCIFHHTNDPLQVSVFSLLIEENENLKVLRSLRTLRALRPLRAISRWQGMRIVVNALMYAIPSIFNVLLVCLVFWLIFSIMGVQFFGGKFFKCVDEEGELLETTVWIPHKYAIRRLISKLFSVQY